MRYLKTGHLELHARAFAPTLSAAGELCGALFAGEPQATATAEELCRYAEMSRRSLSRSHPAASAMADRAEAVLIFPCIMRLGLIAGGAYGEGLLSKGTTVAGYYRLVTRFWGLQAGAQCFSYIVCLMTPDAVASVEHSSRLNLGVDLTPTRLNEAAYVDPPRHMPTANAYALVFDPQGVMLGLGMETTNISRIQPRSVHDTPSDAGDTGRVRADVRALPPSRRLASSAGLERKRGRG